jgi:signal transduction histidine kinase
VQELLNNTVKYANASEDTLQLTRYEDQLMLIYEDDGQGFDPRATPATGRGMGLRNMDARARLIHGTLTLDSRPGHGVTAVLEVPLAV